jgi:hypothetical protein
MLDKIYKKKFLSSLDCFVKSYKMVEKKFKNIQNQKLKKITDKTLKKWIFETRKKI